MRNKVTNQLLEMNEDELRIVSTSKQSLSKVVAHLFQEIAYSMGYKIALPFSHATKIIESVLKDISDVFSSAFQNVCE